MSGPCGILNAVQRLLGAAGDYVRANELLDGVSPLLVFQQRHAATTGLTYAYYGGRSPFTGDPVTAGTVDLSSLASTTVYVVVAKADDTVSADDATTNWDDHANYA